MWQFLRDMGRTNMGIMSSGLRDLLSEHLRQMLLPYDCLLLQVKQLIQGKNQYVDEDLIQVVRLQFFVFRVKLETQGLIVKFSLEVVWNLVCIILTEMGGLINLLEI
eukprot:TRINITY_DN38238_c0_g1_i1.p3 TRINITY_DN38238_c0_g1~~TRINITY_DN38238_c0_g1_i1.p3  ORF type:complete len:107 (+),score=5.38 TRINITY_DN38238_c0_g1_i1:124-444(+)